MRKLFLRAAVLTLGIWAIPTESAALTCPADFSGDTTRTYTVVGTGTTSVSGCVIYADNLNGQLDDDFAQDGTGTTNNFGGGWTSACSTGTNDNPLTCEGTVSVSNFNIEYTGGLNDGYGTFSFTGIAGTEYAIGLVDGGVPKAAVFLLSSTTTSFTGEWTIQLEGGAGQITQDNTADSHWLVYDRPGTVTGQPTQVPEPTSLLLFGTALGFVAHRARRQNRK